MRFDNRILTGKVEKLYNSKYPDPGYKESDASLNQLCNELEFTLDGIKGERHVGSQYSSGGRLKRIYSAGTVIRNNRQWAAISPEELNIVKENMGVQGELSCAHLGINMLISGIGKTYDLGPNKYLVFSSNPKFEPGNAGDTVLVIFGSMGPCRKTGRVIAKSFNDDRLERLFPKSAIGNRGCTGWVEKAGTVTPGQFVHVLHPTGQV